MIETEGGTRPAVLDSLSTAKAHFVRVTASQEVESLAEDDKTITATEPASDGIKQNCIIRETTV